MDIKHIEQKVTGYILTGDAGLSINDVKNGYICKICTIDKNNRFVDISVTRQQRNQLFETLKNDIRNDIFKCDQTTRREEDHDTP